MNDNENNEVSKVSLSYHHGSATMKGFYAFQGMMLFCLHFT